MEPAWNVFTACLDGPHPTLALQLSCRVNHHRIGSKRSIERSATRMKDGLGSKRPSATHWSSSAERSRILSGGFAVKSPVPPRRLCPLDIPPEAVAEAVGQHLRKIYANWADEPLAVLDGKTPREAIQTRQGLEQVKLLLHTYEHGERKQAENQLRPAVSYDFLWHELGITP